MRRRPVRMVIADADPPAEVAAAPEELDARDISAMADAGDAHSPMSPDDQVSNVQTGLHTEEHSTHGNTPAS